MDFSSASTKPAVKSIVSPWINYKRRSDMIKVRARIVEWDDGKFMEIEAPGGDQTTCPHCKAVISETRGQKVLTTYLRPRAFHEQYKPITVPGDK